MIKHYFNIFYFNPYIALIFVIISLLTLIFMCVFCVILFLDSLYRPNIQQYPYNLVLDRMLPMIALLSPSILVLSLNLKSVSLLEKFAYILFFHVFILTPLMYYWSYHRNWGFDNSVGYKNTWNNPQAYLDVTVAMIYPAIWGIYISFARYLRLGSEINISAHLTLNFWLILLLLILLGPYTISWLFLLLRGFMELRIFLWNRFFMLLKSVLIFLLKYKPVFYVLEKIYILSFLWVTFVIHHPGIYHNHPRNVFRIAIHKLYLNAFPLYLIISICIVIELIITKGKIYYSLYILLLFILGKSILYIFNNFCGPSNIWVQLCCYSNYVNYKWEDAYYRKRFWLSFNQMRADFYNFPPLTDDNYSNIQRIIHIWELKNKKDRSQNLRIFLRLMKKPKKRFNYRVKLAYYRWTGIK